MRLRVRKRQGLRKRRAAPLLIAPILAIAGLLIASTLPGTADATATLYSGIIYSEAGGPGYGIGTSATATSINPTGLAITTTGLYVSDQRSNVVRDVVPSTGAISIVGGNGIPGYSGDGGSARIAELNSPSAIANTESTLYISDTYNNVVRKIVRGSGIITTVAGDGAQGYTGDAGPATSAELNHPEGLAIDSSGDVVIADTGNNVVREVNGSTGIIMTIAGNGAAGLTGNSGPATSAELNHPEGLALDPGGSVYIADTNNDMIRKVASGNIYDVAGTGVGGYAGDSGSATSAELDSPSGVGIDGDYNIYIADTLNNVVRKVLSSGGTISTFAGTGTPGFSGDGSSATSARLNGPTSISIATSGPVYIGDTLNNRIREVSGASKTISTIGGNGSESDSGQGAISTNSQLSSNTGVASDASGNLYFCDSNNNRVKEIVVSTGNVINFAGTGIAGYSGDGGSATAARLDQPSGIAVDAAGDVYISDTENNVVREVAAGSGAISTVVGDGTRGYAGDGAPATQAELNGPSGLAFQSSGNLLVVDSGNSAVRLVSTSGTISTYGGGVGGGLATSMSLDPRQMVVSGSSDYVVDFTHSLVRRIDISTGATSVVAGDGISGYSGDGSAATNAELNEPTGLAMDSSGNLYIADTGNNVIREVSASSGLISTYAGDGTSGYAGDGASAMAAELDAPSSVCVDSSGNLDIADTANNVVRQVVAGTGNMATLAGTGLIGYGGDGSAATSATFGGFINGLACDSAGNVLISDAGNFVVRKVSPAGIISTAVGTGVAGQSGDGGPGTFAEIDQASGMTLDSSGDLFIADQGAADVREVNASTGNISTVAGDGTSGFSGDGGPATAAELGQPNSVAVDDAGNLYVSDADNARVRVVSTSTGIINTFAGNGSLSYSGDGSSAVGAELDHPTGIAITLTGQVLISDSGNNVIRSIDPVSGIISTYAGNGISGYAGDGTSNYGAVEFDNPQGIAVLGSSVLVSDSGNSRIRQLAGTVTTIAGNNVAGESGDGGPATSASLQGPTAINVDVNGNIWISDTGNSRLRVVGGGGSL